MGAFTDSQQIFADYDVLRDHYVPDQLMERDDEKEAYVNSLKPVTLGSTPNNVFVYGDTGVGKTVATRKILNELQEDTASMDGIDVAVVWQNCKELTSYETAIELVNNFRELDDQLSHRGHARSKIYNQLWEYIDETDASHLIFVLDEIDSLGTDDNLLYQIPRAQSNNKVETTKIGLIGISNDFTYRENLSSRVTSTLCEKEIRFGPYNANELRPILQQRAKKAFLDGVVDKPVIAKTAALAAQDTGSARHALDILKESGDIADENGADSITEAHVEEAYEEVERGKTRSQLRDLPTQSKLVLQALLSLSFNGETPAMKQTVYDVYEQIAQDINTDVKSTRTIHDRLNQLSLNGFVHMDQRNEGLSGGIYNQYDLDIREEIVTEVLKENNRISELVETTTLDSFN